MACVTWPVIQVLREPRRACGSLQPPATSMLHLSSSVQPTQHIYTQPAPRTGTSWHLAPVHMASGNWGEWKDEWKDGSMSLIPCPHGVPRSEYSRGGKLEVNIGSHVVMYSTYKPPGMITTLPHVDTVKYLEFDTTARPSHAPTSKPRSRFQVN